MSGSQKSCWNFDWNCVSFIISFLENYPHRNIEPLCPREDLFIEAFCVCLKKALEFSVIIVVSIVNGIFKLITRFK